jgi:MarR family transcriptional regulator, transcriptional regulator for hemolysin
MQSQKKKRRWDPEGSCAYWINQASRALLRLHEARLRPLGFGMSHLPVLFALEEREPLSQKELAQAARVEQPTMAEALARMERDGVVQREPNPHDKRGSLTSLTPAARVRLPDVKAALWRGEDEATAALSAKEKAQLIELLKRVVGSLETIDAP